MEYVSEDDVLEGPTGGTEDATGKGPHFYSHKSCPSESLPSNCLLSTRSTYRVSTKPIRVKSTRTSCNVYLRRSSVRWVPKHLPMSSRDTKRHGSLSSTPVWTDVPFNPLLHKRVEVLIPGSILVSKKYVYLINFPRLNPCWSSSRCSL